MFAQPPDTTTTWKEGTAMADDLIGPKGETISAESLRGQQARETQREVDARMASYFSTSTEHAAYNIDDVRALYRKAI